MLAPVPSARSVGPANVARDLALLIGQSLAGLVPNRDDELVPHHRPTSSLRCTIAAWPEGSLEIFVLTRTEYI